MVRYWPAVLLLFAVGCNLPRDPEGTSERIAATHELRVGATDNGPWVDAHFAEPRGIEPQLVREFASAIGAHVLWTRGSETSLAQSLKHHDLDLVIGGFDSSTPWRSTAGISQPFAETNDGKKHVMLVPAGENGFMLRLDKFLAHHLHASQGLGR